MLLVPVRAILSLSGINVKHQLRGRSVAPPYLTEMELKSEYEVIVR